MKCYYCNSQTLDNKSLCNKHAKIKSEQQKIIRAKRDELNLCTNCGGQRDDGDKTQCIKCNEQQKANRIIREQQRKDNNCCAACGRSKVYVESWTNRNCVGCHLTSKFKFTNTKEEAENIINDLLKKQNYKCALTGRDLKTNKYHIDHIIAKSTDITLLSDPSNWQIIVEDANFFKKNKTIEQLLAVSLDIVKESIRKGLISANDLQMVDLDENR